MNAITPMSVSGSLATRAMVVSLNISAWSGHRFDRAVTNEVKRQHGAKDDAGNFNKHLLPKEALDGINKVISATRNDFLERTLPWLNDGSRIMRADAFLRHAEWFRGQKVRFEDEVNKFLAQYPTYKQAAEVKLGSMYKASDYPTDWELRRKFGMDMRVLPVQTSDDFRVEISDHQAEAIRQQIEATVTDATRSAVRNIYERVQDVMGRVVERLTAYRPAGNGKPAEGIFRDTLITNVRELIAIMPSLNITGDPELDRLAEELQTVAKFDPDTLRFSDAARDATKAKAEAILNHIGDFLA